MAFLLNEPPGPGAAAEDNSETLSPSSAISAVFLQLLPRVARLMPRTSWILRLLCKAAAATLRGTQHATVHLSEPAPPAEFRWRWCGPQSLRSTTLRQRRQLEELVARSGVVANLEALAEAHGGDLPLLSRPAAQWGPLLNAATGAGRLEACLWLHAQRGVPLSKSCLEGAAVGGHMDVCEWLLDRGCEWKVDAVFASVRHGHVQLTERLLQLRPQGVPFTDLTALMLLEEAVHGCDMPTVQRLHAEHVASRGLKLCGGAGVNCITSAVDSPTPDWAVKVEWLEGLGCPRDALAAACVPAACCKDGAARLAWLFARSYQDVESADTYADCACAAAQTYNTEALRYMLAQGAQLEPIWTLPILVYDACASGSLETLQVLWDADGTPDACAVQAAALSGHLHIVSWAAQQLGDEVLRRADLFNAAAHSGSLPLLRWLHERGCPWDNDTMAAAARAGSKEALEWLHERGCPWGEGSDVFEAAAKAGCEEALEWLVERGCPMGEDGAAYAAAAAAYDPATVRSLARLGCPFAPDGSTFTKVAYAVGRQPHFDPRPLQWLLGTACPVDWDATMRAVGETLSPYSSASSSDDDVERSEARNASLGALHDWLVQQRL